jgi:hypothetical protein
MGNIWKYGDNMEIIHGDNIWSYENTIKSLRCKCGKLWKSVTHDVDCLLQSIPFVSLVCRPPLLYRTVWTWTRSTGVAMVPQTLSRCQNVQLSGIEDIDSDPNISYIYIYGWTYFWFSPTVLLLKSARSAIGLSVKRHRPFCLPTCSIYMHLCCIYIYLRISMVCIQLWGWGHYLVGDYLGWACKGGKKIRKNRQIRKIRNK